jgi:transcription initiation factor IIE alpha subunit
MTDEQYRELRKRLSFDEARRAIQALNVTPPAAYFAERDERKGVKHSVWKEDA